MAFNNEHTAAYRTPHEANIRDGGKTVTSSLNIFPEPVVKKDGGGPWRNLENNALSSLH